MEQKPLIRGKLRMVLRKSVSHRIQDQKIRIFRKKCILKLEHLAILCQNHLLWYMVNHLDANPYASQQPQRCYLDAACSPLCPNIWGAEPSRIGISVHKNTSIIGRLQSAQPQSASHGLNASASPGTANDEPRYPCRRGRYYSLRAIR